MRLDYGRLIVTLCFIMFFMVSAAAVVHAELFVRQTPKNESAQAVQEKQDKKSFWQKMFNIPDSVKQKASPVSKLTKTQVIERPSKPKSSINYSAIEFYRLARDVDEEVLRISGRDPQTPEELMQVAAAYNTPKMASMLETRRKNRESLKRAQQQYEMNAARMKLLRQRGRVQDASTPSPRAAPVKPRSSVDNEPPPSQEPPRRRLFITPRNSDKPTKPFTDF